MEKQKLFILIAQGVAMLGVAFAPFFDPGVFDFSLIPFAWHKIIGVLMNCSGFVICASAAHFLWRKFTVSAQPRQGTSLITGGPFHYVRNPMYFGGLLMCFGWSVSMSSCLGVIFSTLLASILLVKMNMEERFLEGQFGAEYTAYKLRVRKIIPFVF